MNRKGISMISLVVIVIVTIILIGIATTAGYRYVTQINDVRAQTLSDAIGSAAYRRQNDVSTGVAQRFYEGFAFDVNLVDFSKVFTIEGEDSSGDGIPDVLQEDGSLWYLVDAESATNLGSDGGESYLTRNVAYYIRPDVTDEEREELVRVVLADYSTGKAFYVKMPASEAINAINRSAGNCPNSPTGNHRFTIATCTEPSICIYGCGTINHAALGHAWIESTCTTGGYCERCKVLNPDDPAQGHQLITSEQVTRQELIDFLAQSDCHMLVNQDDYNKAWIVDANKHWHQCIKCGARFEESSHVRSFYSIDDKTHQEVCSVCDWHSIVSLHKIKHSYTYNDVDHTTTHIVWCEACDYGAKDSVGGLQVHQDTGWLPGNPSFHYRICEHTQTDYCNTILKVDTIDENGNPQVVDVVYKEPHIDENDDFVCDVCGRIMDNIPPLDFGLDDYGTYARIIDEHQFIIIILVF